MIEDKDILDPPKMAEDSLEVAEDLFDGGHHGFSASRSYYAMFYTTEAILITKESIIFKTQGSYCRIWERVY